MDARTKLLLEGPIGPTLLRLALPNVLVMIMQAAIGLIETYFVARLGADALTGMALVFPVLMLFQMISAGAMGGGILSAVARALGAGRRADAEALVWHAVALALGLGLLTTLATLLAGPKLYALMGGRDGSLAAANLYSGIVFSGAVLLWLFNSLAAIIRGTGNMTFPATVISLGAIVLVPLSPALIFGFGPLPQLGIAGGAVAVILYYAAGSVAFIFFLWSGRGVLRPALRPPPLSWTRIRDILAVGAAASLIATTTNVSIGLATGFAGRYGPAAVAGYGTGARLEYLLVPLVFGLGAPLAAMVGTSIGAGCRDRAVRVAWVGAAMAGAITEAIGLAGALAPEAWLGLYSQDPGVLSYGSRYLHLVGPFYGCFGFGFALYFAAQGTGRLVWALFAGAARLATVCILGLIAVHAGSVAGLFTALGLAMIVFGGINAIATATGAWLSHTKLARPLPEAVTEAR